MESTKWQGQTLDFVWADEEPPIAHYNEALARLTGQGVAFITFTPLLGYSEVVSRFLRETDADKLAYRSVTRMGLGDVGHFTEQEKQARLAAYAPHEREARERGDPTLGSGAVFTIPQTDLAIDSNIHVPLHWCKLWGVDYGVTHPFAAVLMAWDRDADILYILDTIRLSNSRPIEHASAMKRIAPDVRVSWPHDGSKRESDLDTITSNYRREGLYMLPTHATFTDGSISTEAGILEMQERMATGRFRVRAHLADWFDEYRSYHRDKEGRLVKVRDDLLSATRIAVMAKRFARPGPIGPGTAGVGRRVMPAQARNVDYDMFA
jgi:phage terminase large subunit-like protein